MMRGYCMRRGQFEMIGLVFIVVIIVIGIMLYLSFVGKDPQNKLVKQATKAEGANSFLIALSETHVPKCGTAVTVTMLARACNDNAAIGACTTPCSDLQDVFNGITAATLNAQGLKYSLSFNGVSSAYGGCSPTSPDTTMIPTMPVPISGSSKDIVLALCR